MAKLDDLQARAAQLKKEIDDVLNRAIAEGRAVSAEEQQAIDRKKAELEPLVNTIKLARAHDALTADLDAPATEPEKPASGIDTRAATNIRVGETREAGKPFRTFGEQLRAIMAAEDRGTRAVDPRLIRLNEEMRAASGLNEGTPSEGGFAVQSDFVQAIMGRIFDQQTGVIASRVSRIEIGANANGLKQNVIDETSRATGSRWGGVRAYWVGEADAFTASKPKLRQMSMDLEKLAALWYLTEELIQDSTALGSVAEQAFAEEIQFVAEDAIINGTGAGMPLGILNSPALVSQAIEAGQTVANTASHIAANTSKMLARFNGNRSRAVWLANIELFPKISLATLGGTSSPVYLPGGTIANTPFGSIWGIPVFFVEYSAAEGTVGDLMLSDLGYYAMIAKGSPKFAQSMHVRFLNDEQTFRVTFRCNGQPIPSAPITPYKGSATRSPFVALAGRS